MVGLRDIPRDLAGIFIFLAGDLAGIRFRAALCLGWTGLTDLFQRPIAGCALAGWPAVRIGVVPAELLQLVPLRANVLVVLRIPFKVGAGPCSVIAP